LQGKKSMMNKEGGQAITGHEGHVEMSVDKKNEPTQGNPAHTRVQVDQEFKQQLQKAFEAYIGIKEALVKDDQSMVRQNAVVLSSSLDQIDMKLLTEPEMHHHWMKAEKQMHQSATSIEATSDIEEQRSHFKELSTAITSAVQMFGVGQVVYNQFCPMADNNKGAYWLSNEKNVLNPYFGKAMLACGSVKQIIRE